jgi:hypothetical protein
MLGSNPTQERFRLAAYYLTGLSFQASGDEPLGWGEFMERYTTMYPRGQPSLPDDPVTAYVNGLRTTGAAPGSTTTRRTRTARRHDPTRECNVCVATASSSFESEPAPCHRGADDQWRARLDKLVEARRQLDEELDLLHQELGIEIGPRDRHPAQDVPVQGEPHKGNGDRREPRPTADQLCGRVPTPPARTLEPDNNRRANGGANANADAPPLFRQASQNLAAAAMLLRGCPEPTISQERRVREQLKALLETAAAQQVENSASRKRSERGRAGAPSAHGPNLPPPQSQGHGDGVGATASAVKSRLRPHRDARHTIEARRRAESVDNNNDNCSCHNDDRGHRRCHDSDDDRERI